MVDKCATMMLVRRHRASLAHAARGTPIARSLILAAALVVTVVGAAIGETRPNAPDELREASPRPERLTGVTLPGREVVLSSLVEGVLDTLPAEEGALVEAGELIASIDDALQVAAVNAARLQATHDARIRRAEFARDEAANELARYEWLHDQVAATEWERDRSRLRLEQAAALIDIERERLELAEVEYAIEQLRLERFQIRAPFAGRVVRRLVEVGQVIGVGEELVRLVALDPLRAELHLPVDVYEGLEVGRRYRLQAHAPVNRPIVGMLKTVDPLVDPASRTVRCVFTIDNPEYRWPAGFRVQVQWPLAPLSDDDVIELAGRINATQ